MPPIQKVLIANRGEIACRVVRTARAMNIKTVAVFCDAERDAKHVLAADESYRLGAPPATTSYLRADKVIEVAKKSGAHAIHPGYGFLSENADFADAVAAAGLVFIGPPASAIRSMGSKSESKIIMIRSNVPVLEGYNGEDQKDEKLLAEAKKIGFPVLIKAVMGGGGKGMKLVFKESEFIPQLHSARREATNFFKDSRVIIERYVTSPRHIEVQVMCDAHGNGVYFFERDCSVQRRHQKVLEECPSDIPRTVAKTMGEVAVRAAKAVGYVGAGTVEFIYDAQKDTYYFMEMNTRLQVEHPVTEEAVRVKGQPLDLVQLQLLVAMGHPLPCTQSDITIAGHAAEARVYAESPKEGFLPGSGHLRFVEEPATGSTATSRVRVDTGFRTDDDVLVHYDPMIAKVIAWGTDRKTALDTLHRALQQYYVVGIPTNIEFLQRSINHAAFRAGGVTTKFIEENAASLLAPKNSPSHHLALVCAVLCMDNINGYGKSVAARDLMSFRLNQPLTRTVNIRDSDKATHSVKCTVKSTADDDVVRSASYLTLTIRVPQVGGRSEATHTIEIRRDGMVTVQGGAVVSTYTAFVDNLSRVEFRTVAGTGNAFGENVIDLLLPDGAALHFQVLEEDLETPAAGEGQTRAALKVDGVVRSPINGKVVKLCFAEGAAVQKGQVILILEAMKMEHNVKASCDGVVSYMCKEKGMVLSESTIAKIAPAKSS